MCPPVLTAADELDVRNRTGRTAAAPGADGRDYSPFADLDGNDRIDVLDFAVARAPAHDRPAAGRRRRPVRRPAGCRRGAAAR